MCACMCAWRRNVQIELSSASIASHDTVNDGGRFTVFNIEIKTKMGTFTVARRYSEFRDLYDNLNKASQQRAHTRVLACGVRCWHSPLE